MSTARISFTQINTRILDRLFQNFNKLEGIQEQLATGKRVNKPSDDPIAVTNAMEMRSEVNRLNTYQRNIDDGLAYLGTVETTLSTSNNLYQNMRERAIQASNDSYTADSRKFIGQEVKGMLEQKANEDQKLLPTSTRARPNLRVHRLPDLCAKITCFCTLMTGALQK